MAAWYKTRWGAAHMRTLRDKIMPEPGQCIVLEEYLMAIDRASERIARLDTQLEGMAEG